jgi:effector-binding domain-containing protein
LNRVLTQGLPRAEVRLTREDARRVAVTSAVGTIEEIGPVTSDCVARLGRALAAAGRQPRGPLIGLFPLDLTDQVTLRVAAEVDQDVAGTAREVLGGGLFAVATHVGPYDQLSLTIHALLAWIGEHGHTVGGGLREVYLSDPQQTAPEQLVTHLMVKVKEEEEESA